jgi:hypothetical protein
VSSTLPEPLPEVLTGLGGALATGLVHEVIIGKDQPYDYGELIRRHHSAALSFLATTVETFTQGRYSIRLMQHSARICSRNERALFYVAVCDSRRAAGQEVVALRPGERQYLISAEPYRAIGIRAMMIWRLSGT